MELSLCKTALAEGGSIHPLIIPSEATEGLGLMNPSVYQDGEHLLVAIRHINYILYHSENRKFPCTWGPLQYINPENDQHLRTKIFIAELDKDTLEIAKWWPVNMTRDQPSNCEFIGLEDSRLFRWEDKLFLCGVRRDADVKSTGRMELSEIVLEGNEYKEVSRARIPIPGPGDSYCEKNWIPILDNPYHFVKWMRPVEVVEYSPETRVTNTVKLGKNSGKVFSDIRGGSQVIPYRGGYLAVGHDTIHQDTLVGHKDAIYRHRFIYFNSNLDIIRVSEMFNFMDAKIEFCCGMVHRDDSFLLSFGFQDNAAYLLEVPETVVLSLLGDLE